MQRERTITLSTLINNILFTKKLLPLIWGVISMKFKPMHNNWGEEGGRGDLVMGQRKVGKNFGARGGSITM